MRAFVLPPVRRPVPLRRVDPAEGRKIARRFFGGREVLLLGSGTQALAAALIQSRARRADVSAPEALLPAYGCPDLVSACVQAGVKPKLVDIAAGTWGYDPHALQSALSSRTVAVVAVNLLGVGDGAAELLPVARAANAFLIQDSAQYLPRSGGPWCGDALVLSFGRGKPLNLLQGGALVLASKGVNADSGLNVDSGCSANSSYEVVRGLRCRLLLSRAAGVLFNAVTHPFLYGWISRLPGMGLGETRYKPPYGIWRLPERAWGQVGPALDDYGRAASYNGAVWNDALAGWSEFGVTPLVASTGPRPGTELLRLPLIARDRDARDRLVARLNQSGLGASTMYDQPLNRVVGLPPEVAAQGPFPKAEDLAGRLFTLPTHSCVSDVIRPG